MNSKIRKTAEELLGRSLTKSDGMSTLEIKKIEDSLGLKLPTVLKDFYLLVGNLEIFMSSFDDFSKPRIKNDWLVFLDENQGVCCWGVNHQDTENDLVFQCTNIESANPEWYSAEVTLTDFLIIIMYLQCAYGGYKHGSAVYEEDFDSSEKYSQFLANITTGYKKVVEHNGIVIYQNEGKLIWHYTDDEGNLADVITASTRTVEDQKEFEPYGFRKY